MTRTRRYSLAGIQTATTDPQRELIRRASEVATRDERILAAYLVGGFAVGTGDAWSDVDLQFVVRDDAEVDLRESWRDVANALAPTCYTQGLGATIGGLCITPEWLHFDVVFLPASTVRAESIEGMIPLADKVGLLPRDPVPRPDRREEPFYPAGAVQHFLYMVGNVVSVIARDEIIPASNGVIMVRDLDLVSLLLAEEGWTTTREHTFGNPFPFTKRLRTYLTAEQNSVLESLPPVAPTIDSVIDGYVAIAEVFLPRARRLAGLVGDAWPEAFERASVDYFERSLGATITY